MEAIPPGYDEVTNERLYHQEWLEYFHYIGWEEALRSYPLEYHSLMARQAAENATLLPSSSERRQDLNPVGRGRRRGDGESGGGTTGRVTRREDAMRFVDKDDDNDSHSLWSDFDSSSSSSEDEDRESRKDERGGSSHGRRRGREDGGSSRHRSHRSTGDEDGHHRSSDRRNDRRKRSRGREAEEGGDRHRRRSSRHRHHRHRDGSSRGRREVGGEGSGTSDRRRDYRSSGPTGAPEEGSRYGRHYLLRDGSEGGSDGRGIAVSSSPYSNPREPLYDSRRDASHRSRPSRRDR